MSLENIKTAIYKHIDLQVFGVPVLYTNEEKETQTGPHLIAMVLPAKTDSVGLNSIDKEQGIVQIDIMIKSGGGEIESAKLVDKVIDAFPRGLKLIENNQEICFNHKGWPSGDLQLGDWVKTPVSIRFHSFAG